MGIIFACPEGSGTREEASLVTGRRLAIILHDLVVVAAAWLLVYLIRFDFNITASGWASFRQSLPIVIAVQGVLLWYFGLSRGIWRFASIPDLWNITRTAVLGTLAIALSLFLFNRLQGVPRTVLAAYPLCLILLLGGPRLIYRVWRDYGLGLFGTGNSKRVVILGAGRAGEMLARDMRRDASYEPVAFFDDARILQGSKVHGVPVIGSIDRLPDYVGRLRVDLVIIAMPSATNAEMRRIVEICEQCGIPFRTLPRLHDLSSERPTMSELREVNIEDLLGRDPIILEWTRIAEGIVGKTVLVSGAGGSIGSELCRQIARLRPAVLVLFENNEYNLFHIENELRARYPELTLHAFLGDVRDRASVHRAFERYRPEITFHAAAYKHVPMLEFNIREAVRNNILGTRMMAQAADQYGCGAFVMISTDKAVKPTNVMGASKRIAEIWCQALARRSSTRFITVRFGNVLGSAGSVVPIFREQILKGGPVTVTHPNMMRYFMTIPEASQLILQAATMGRGGEIFVLDMGEPVSITYLAEQMIRLSGKRPHVDIPIVYTGLRPGEKLFEELFYDGEQRIATGHRKILLARFADVDWDELNVAMKELEAAADSWDEEGMRAVLERLVPGLAAKPEPQTADNVIAFERARKA
jgi:FlaA1/EpsC-like NDP-sugar epimerase